MSRYSRKTLSNTSPNPTQYTASGMWSMVDQLQAQNAAKWPSAADKIFNISPAVSGKTLWDLKVDGNLTLEAGTEYTIINPYPSTIYLTVKLWGGGSSGQGGFTSGVYILPGNGSIKCQAGAAGASTQGGGGASAIYSATNSNTVYAVAGGGGGAGNGTTGGGHGGGTSGNAGSACTGAVGTANGGGGGTQSLGGTGGSGDRGSGASGAFKQGGAGFGNSTVYAGGTGWAPGGDGLFKSGDGTQGGGGGGYYGGGGGGASSCGGAGGGGSGYIGGLVVESAQTTVGVGTDPDRGTAGNSGTNGKIMFFY